MKVQYEFVTFYLIQLTDGSCSLANLTYLEAGVSDEEAKQVHFYILNILYWSNMQVMVDVGLINKLIRVPLLLMVTENGSITFGEVFVLL